MTGRVAWRACNAFEKTGRRGIRPHDDALHLACAVENQFSEVYKETEYCCSRAAFWAEGISVSLKPHGVGSFPRRTVSEYGGKFVN